MTDRTLQTLGFVPEPVEVFTDIESALKKAPDYFVKRTSIDPAKLSFEYNGSAVFNVDGNKIKTSKNGLCSYCKLVKIPDPFANTIPLDLLQQNLNRLTYRLNEVEVVLDNAGNIVAFVPAGYRPIQTFDLLVSLEKIMQEHQADNVKIVLGIINSMVTYTTPTFPTLEPKPGDFIRAGIEIANSEAQGIDAQASLFLHRLVCSNGAYMPSKWGNIKRNSNPKTSYDSMLASFLGRLKGLRTDFDALTETFKDLPTIKLNSKEATLTYKSIAHVFDEGVALDTLKVEKDAIKEIMDFERKRNDWRVIDSTNSVYGYPARETGINAYDVYNNITQFGRDVLNVNSARKARAIGGNLITMLFKERVKK